MRSSRLYVADIRDAMDSIAGFIADLDYERFLSDDKTVSAVLRKLEVIGEAAKSVPGDIRNKWPDIPWKEMAGMRDRIIH